MSKEFLEYLEEKAIEEGFEGDFMKALKKVKGKDSPDNSTDLDDEGVSKKLKKNLESLVKIMNKKVGDEFTEKDFNGWAARLFDKTESKRILNHFLRKKVITGASASAGKPSYEIMRNIERKDFMNFY